MNYLLKKKDFFCFSIHVSVVKSYWLIVIISERIKWGMYKKGYRCGERLRGKAGGGQTLTHTRWSWLYMSVLIDRGKNWFNLSFVLQLLSFLFRKRKEKRKKKKTKNNTRLCGAQKHTNARWSTYDIFCAHHCELVCPPGRVRPSKQGGSLWLCSPRNILPPLQLHPFTNPHRYIVKNITDLVFTMWSKIQSCILN